MIFNFAQLSNYGKALKYVGNDVETLSALTQNLTAQQTINALSTKALTSDKLKEILANKGLTEAEINATIAKINSVAANQTAAFSLKAYTTALWANTKAMAVWMVTNPIGIIMGIVAAVKIASDVWDYFDETLEEQKEKVEDLKQSYQSTSDSLKAITDEITENSKRIEELEQKSQNGTITLIEEDELEKLRITNDLLKEQEVTKKNLAQEDARELSNDNQEVFNREFGNVDTDLSNYQMYGANILEGEDLSDKDLILSIKALYGGINDALAEGDTETAENLQEGQKDLIQILNERSNTILSNLLEYQDTLSLFMNENGTFDNVNDQKLWDDIEEWKKEIYKQTSRSGEWNTLQIETALDDTSFDQAINDIAEKVEQGTLKEEDLNLYDDLISALNEANLILEEGETPASVYFKYLRDILKTQNAINETSPKFVFNDDNSDEIDQYQSRLNSLSEALEKLQNGQMSGNDMVDLLQSFPELTDKTENLSNAIQNLIDKELNTLKEKLKEAGATDDILTLFDDIANESSELNLDNVLSQLESGHSLIENVTKEISKTGKISVDSVQDIISQYPKLEKSVNDYLDSKISEKELLQNLQEEYDADLQNYYDYIASKKGEDTSFYDSIKDKLSDDLVDKANQYNIDLTNYKTYNEAKLELDKKYELKKLQLQQATERYKETETDKTHYGLNPSISAYDEMTDAQKDLDEVEEIINGFDTTVDLVLPKFETKLSFNDDDPDKKEDKEFSEDIDWIAQSVENAKNKVEDLDDAVNNAQGFTNKINAYKKLGKAADDLVNTTKKAAGEYEDIWTEKSGKIDPKYVDLITSNNENTRNYNQAVADRKKKYKGSKYAGNVDLYNRPILLQDDGTYETLKSETFAYSDFGINKAGAFNVTPILPDGTKLENVGEYIQEQLNKGKKIEDLDIFLGGDYSSIDEAVKAAIKLHEEQDEIYGTEADYLRILKEDTSFLKVENFTSEEEYNNVMEAIAAYAAWKASQGEYQDALEKQKQTQDDTNALYLERAETQLDILNAEDQGKMTVKEKNALLEKEKKIKADILAYNLLLAESEEERTKLEKEYAQYLAGNDEDQYQNLRQERASRADYFGTRIQDIENDIALEEARGGQGTETQYKQINTFLDKQMEVYKVDYEEALAKRNAAKPRTDEWYQYNQEIQEAQDNINKCKVAQIENNKAIMLLPVKAYEDLNKQLEQELETITKSREKIESGISYANTLVQDQIDLLNKNKETITKNYEDQIKEIEEKKDALTKENDEVQRAIDLENAKYALDKALNNKSSRIYRKGEGFVYEANHEDVIKAQQELDKLKRENQISDYEDEIDRLNKEKDTEIDIIDEKVKSWEEYAEMIEKALSSFERFLSLQELLTHFGEDADKRILAHDSNLPVEFETALADVKVKEKNLQNQIEANNLAIQAIQNEADAYIKGAQDITTARNNINQVVTDNEDEINALGARASSVSAYGQAWTTTQQSVDGSLKMIELSNIQATDNEKTILTERIENLKLFKNTAVSYYKDITNAVASAQAAFKQLQNVLEKTKASYAEIIACEQKANAIKNGNDDVVKVAKAKKVDIYHDGGIVGETPQRDIPEHLIALTDANLKPDETFAKLLNGEVVLNSTQMGNMFNNLGRAYSAITPLNKRESSSVDITIGDVNVYNPENTDMIVNEIVKELPLKVIQRLHSK